MDDIITAAVNGTSVCPYDTNLYIQITGTIIFFAVWPFIALDVKCFPIGCPAAALVGAAFMVLFQVVSQSDVYGLKSQKGSFQTIFLLVGVMILYYYYEREGLLKKIVRLIFGDNNSTPLQSILWKVCLMSALLSAFITNDAACLVITPLLLTEFINQDRDKHELLPLCLGIATSANIGSAATVFGNPQNAFIASEAGITLLQFFIAELPAALIGLILNIGLLRFLFVKNCCSNISSLPMFDNISSDKLSQFCFLSSCKKRSNHHETLSNNPMMIDSTGDSLTNSTTTNDDIKQKDDHTNWEKNNRNKWIKIFKWILSKLFVLWLVLITFIGITILALRSYLGEFNLGTVPLVSGIITMLIDTILNRKYAYDVMLKIDWTIILMFMGLFVWLEGFQNTCFPYLVFNKLTPYMNLKSFEGVLIFSVFVIIGSNVFSNVPLVILIVNRITGLCGDVPCTGPLGGLLLAWISTIAGNFTLIGSVANLIVAEKARSSANYRLSFFGYFKYSFILTLVVIYICLPIVYFLGLVAGYVKI